MFEHVGEQEAVATRARFGALGMTISSLAIVAGIAFGLAAIAVQDVLLPPPLEEEMFEVAVLDPVQDQVLEAPAAPPPPLRGAADPDAVSAPEAPPDAPAPLSDDVPDRMVGPAGDPNGHDDGDQNGKIGGTPLLSGTGDGTGPAGRPGQTMQFDDLEIKRRFDPTYPAAAKSLGLGTQRCMAEVRISEEGIPTDVEIRGCPEVFHAETRAALLKWRFYPVRAGKKPVATVTSFGVTYRLD